MYINPLAITATGLVSEASHGSIGKVVLAHHGMLFLGSTHKPCWEGAQQSNARRTAEIQQSGIMSL